MRTERLGKIVNIPEIFQTIIIRLLHHLILDHGIDSGRLESIGYGESRPEVPNDSEENRARNRRVEFRIAE